ncbi:hypothetical protein GOBAR_DD19402 [Gossypium barbadense]|nr:hypothetical protein GOBAR_DD19402 [Gossypium barbadense]
MMMNPPPPVVTFPHQSPNPNTTYAQNLYGSSMDTPFVSSSSCFGNMLYESDPCIWDDANAVVETFEEPRVDSLPPAPQPQQQENDDKIDMDCSLMEGVAGSFDLGLLESTLLFESLWAASGSSFLAKGFDWILAMERDDDDMSHDVEKKSPVTLILVRHNAINGVEE